MAAPVVNLNKARKARDKARRKAGADANAARHGRTKTQKTREAAETARAKAELDGRKRETDPG